MKRRNTIGLLTSAALAVTFAGAPVGAQTDPTEVGGGKKAYVLLVIDSSASMEYTVEGDNVFPTVPALFGGLNSHITFALPGQSEWTVGEAMNATTTNGFGACFMYTPLNSLSCDPYRRPGWREQPTFFMPAPTIPTAPFSWSGAGFFTTDGNLWSRGFYPDSEYPSTLHGLFGLLTGWRLLDQQQPRHVTIKEVLTGDMILLPNFTPTYSPGFYDADVYGPGCWFVPRQRDASAQPLSDQNYCDGVLGFEQYPDHDQPVPHFQEFYDLQHRNGALDLLSSSALFAVAAFDSYRDDMNWYGHNSEINDRIRGDSPSSPSNIRDLDDGLFEDSGDCDDDGTADDPCYNLGVWRIIGPKELEIPSTILPEVTAYTQIAINDTGFLRPETDTEFTLFTDAANSKTNAFLGATFSDRLATYANPVQLAKQPIARATPIAAAIHDIYQFMAHGQDVTVGSASELEHPHLEASNGGDPFSECRPKHVVLLTDGTPEPERDPNHPLGISSTLNEAFGYDATLYTYDTVEEEVDAFVNDIDNVVDPPNGATAEELNAYNPRVHVVGLNLDTVDPDAVAKMAQIAIEGNSCASALLGGAYVPTGVFFDDGSGMVEGTCTAGTGCLVNQASAVSAYQAGGYTWTHPKTGEDYDCSSFPALILDNNDPSTINGAVQAFLSELVGSDALTSRTRLVVSERLDDNTIGSGGQHRFYSGVRVGGGTPWWQGVINRTTQRCDGVAEAAVPIHSEIGTQVTLSGGPQDSRRVWTAVPSDERWCHAAAGPCASPGVPVPVDTYATDTLLPFTYDLQQLGPAADEFSGTYLNVGAPDLVSGTRIPLRRTSLETAYAGAVLQEYNVFDDTEFEEVLDIFRGRLDLRVSMARGGVLEDTIDGPQDRVLGGILNSNPVVVGPPNLDLPIESYREFRAKYADRTSMLYVSSMEGLLHAIHVGNLPNQVSVRGMTTGNGVPAAEIPGDAAAQREAWAFMPWMVHGEMASFQNAQAYLMDGTPAVKDVRLCNRLASENSNLQACEAICPNGACTILPGAEQWRTVLVQGRGLAGAGYYAMDVTRPGGNVLDYSSGFGIEPPDPILLWEFDREWEAAQARYLVDSGDTDLQQRVLVLSPDPSFYGPECSNDPDELSRSALMGLSASEPEIATLIVQGNQRPVAVFGGGSIDPTNTACGGAASGMAVYVVDLQTGSLLRRFTHYIDDANMKEPFADDVSPHRFSGSPTLFDSSTGSVATRGFIGDDAGRLFKMNFLADEPDEWTMHLFYDPSADTNLTDAYTAAGHTGPPTWGPGAFKPALALDPDRNVVVIYGLGEPGDVVSSNQAQAIIALREDRSNPLTSVASWAEVFPEGEKLTGPPVIFNAQVYFPTYALDVDDQCEPGFARIWGLYLKDPNVDPNDITAAGVYGANAEFASGAPMGIILGPGNKWFGPDQPTLIRGLTITLGNLCTADNLDTEPSFSTGDDPAPELVAQTATPVTNDLTTPPANDTQPTHNALDRISLKLQKPKSQTLPLSWSLIY